MINNEQQQPTQYLELYSQHRNRMMFKDPVFFEVPVQPNIKKTTIEKIDPILKDLSIIRGMEQ